MKSINIGKSDFIGSSIIMGCMRINSLSLEEADKLFMTAIECGINFFDHADIYGNGASEELFGKVLKLHPEMRDKIIIQSKCGIAKSDDKIAYFDFSKEHIIEAVDSSLQRLTVDCLDSLLLHRPDTLMEPEEVAEAFDRLYSTGKVKHFGVSNQNPMQIELLKKYVRQPLIMNQLQLSILECGMIGAGLNVNMTNTLSYMHDGGVLEYSRINDMTIQAWSPFQIGFFQGSFIDNEDYPELNNKLAEYAEKYNVSKEAIAVAWILRHPANMQVITGTTKAYRLKAICDADKVNLSRAEWYDLYKSAGHTLP